MSTTAELACSYAALILADDGVEVTVRTPISRCRRFRDMAHEKKKQGLTIISPQALEGKDIKDLLTNVGSGGPAAPAGAVAAAGGEAAAEEKKEEKEEEKEESDEDMGFGLFD
ncbi:hypothetical protein N7474_003992 [Penicillium riverlandense]|uniref:uncharacterized protein n=1 Tax=Penicillium riverlandense TaxID=1903569 RepID=UPI00254960C9|nr:uncharacterized protein N7474_003992 [Penicillium riverlandense]KAJ5818401.1 hypothetical protein N7474_003992 [Penicillium riverlandense]